jgi:FkbM family methyltransferase
MAVRVSLLEPRVPNNSSSVVRRLARTAASLLPAAALRRIAAYRFGYSQEGRHFTFAEEEGPAGPIARIDGRLTLQATADFMPDLRFHFVENGQSRDEIGAFLDIAPTLPPDSVLFDVGAHRGLFSLVYCALSPDRRAVLFEPSASLTKDAGRLIALNGFEGRAEVRVCGVGDRTGQRDIVEDALGFAREASAGAPGAEPIAFTTLDDEWRRTGVAPAVVKIDVEGAEAEVIRGAAALLRTVRPILFLELHMDELERRGESTKALLAQLTAAGYRFGEPDGRPRSARALTRSLRAIIRIVARADGSRQTTVRQ